MPAESPEPVLIILVTKFYQPFANLEKAGALSESCDFHEIVMTNLVCG